MLNCISKLYFVVPNAGLSSFKRCESSNYTFNIQSCPNLIMNASLFIIYSQPKMINIPMQDFIQWFQTKMDIKYAMKMQSLKRSLIFFYNLADQVISLYNMIRLKMEKYNEKQEYNDIMAILNRSLVIVVKIIQKMPTCLDSYFCEKFIKSFDLNINLLCTLYHSLNHYEIINKQNKFEKEKIVQGINKMYTIHVKIKETYKNNIEISQTLTLISDYNKIFKTKIKSITQKLKDRRSLRQQQTQNFQAQAVEFYEGLIEKIQSINEQPEAKKSLMRVYFQLIHQLYSAQAQLELHLEHAIKVCNEIKGRKKNISFIGQQSCNQLTRWINVIFKPSISMKNIKRLKVQDFIKCIGTVLQEKETYNYFYLENFQNHQEEIQTLTNLIIDIARQIDKIQASGLFTLISQYKDNILPPGSKKFINKLIDYHKEMAKFYSLHEETKQLQRFVQTIVLEELGEKMNIIIDQNQDFTLLDEAESKLEENP